MSPHLALDNNIRRSQYDLRGVAACRRDTENVQTSNTEDDRSAVDAAEVAGHVLGLHHKEQQRGIANRVCAAVPDIYHTWSLPGVRDRVRIIAQRRSITLLIS